jgi:secreted trypsin-like serine protease
MFQGDDGGALVIRRDNAWTQIGVVSFFSSSGCDSDDPTGFTRVTYFTPWIRSISGV